MASSSDTKWTQDRMEKTSQWWDAGDNARTIANRLACGFTRNAVLAKISRMRYTRTADGYVAVSPDKAPRRRVGAQSHSARSQFDMPTKALFPMPPKITLATCAGMPIAGPAPIKSECAVEDGCRYPTEQGFCGNEADGSYCDEHHKKTHKVRSVNYEKRLFAALESILDGG